MSSILSPNNPISLLFAQAQIFYCCVIWFSSDLANTILVYRSIGRMHTPVSLSSTALPCAPCKYKRIKDYLYDMEAVLGRGNFSTVYRAVREGTGTSLSTQTKPLR